MTEVTMHYKIKTFARNFIATMLVPILLGACIFSVGKTSTTEPEQLPSNIQATQQSILSPLLLANWKIGEIHDVAWSPDSKMFVVNYRLKNQSDYVVQAFSTVSFNNIWTVDNSTAWNLTFTPDGQFIVESDVFIPFFYWRNKEDGKVVYMGEFTSTNQIRKEGCTDGGQFLLTNTRQNTAFIADYYELIGLGKNHTVVIRQLDLETRICKNLFEYKGSFTIFDLNSNGTLLAYGGVGENNSVVIWDVNEQIDVCHIPKAGYGRFIPSENTLAVVKEQKIILFDALTCIKIREMNISPISKYENYLALSPDGNQIVIARDSIDILDMSTNEILAQLPFPENAIPISNELFLSGIKFSPDGRYLLITYFF